MEQQSMVWNEIYSMQYYDGPVLMARQYFDNNHIKEYNLDSGDLVDTRKMTEEDHQFLNKELNDMKKAFDKAYKGMEAMGKREEESKYFY